MKKILFIVIPIFLVIILLTTVDLKSLSNKNNMSTICDPSQSYVVDPELREVLNFVYSNLDQMDLAYTDLSDCIDLEFINLEGAEASFKIDNKLNIHLNPKYKGKDKVLVSIPLLHELAHLEQYINNTITTEYPECIDNEVNAFFFQTLFLSKLPQAYYDKLYSLVESSPNEYLAIKETINTYIEVSNSCRDVPNSTKSECMRENIFTKYKTKVLSDSGYQDQCHISE